MNEEDLKACMRELLQHSPDEMSAVRALIDLLGEVGNPQSLHDDGRSSKQAESDKRLQDTALLQEAVRCIEEGLPLPPIDPGRVKTPTESRESFERRMRASVEAFRRGFKGSKHAGSQVDMAALSSFEWRGPFQHVDDHLAEEHEHVLAPDLPEAELVAAKHAERAAYLLRRGHAASDPRAPLLELSRRGLLAGDVQLSDPWACVEGAEDALAYVEMMHSAGMESEVFKVALTIESYTPAPEWAVLVDVWLHLPLPSWYCRYSLLNTPPAPARRGTLVDGILLAPGSEAGLGGPGQANALYPRREGGDSWVRAAPGNRRRHLCWLRPRSKDGQALPEASRTMSRAHAALRGEHVLGTWQDWAGNEAVEEPVDPSSPVGAASWPQPRPALPKGTSKAEQEEVMRAWCGRGYDPSAPQPRRKRGAAARTPEPGARWVEGGWLTVSASWRYTVDPRRGGVASAECFWGGTSGMLHTPQDAADVYLHEMGLVRDVSMGYMDQGAGPCSSM